MACHRLAEQKPVRMILQMCGNNKTGLDKSVGKKKLRPLTGERSVHHSITVEYFKRRMWICFRLEKLEATSSSKSCPKRPKKLF